MTESMRSLLERRLQGDTSPILPAEGYSSPRYRCRQCLDSGLVDVWASRSVEAALKGAVEPKDRNTAVIPCNCVAGERYYLEPGAKAPPKWHGFRYRYDPEHHCRCPMGDCNKQAHVDELIAWAAETKERVTTFDPTQWDYKTIAGGE